MFEGWIIGSLGPLAIGLCLVLGGSFYWTARVIAQWAVSDLYKGILVALNLVVYAAILVLIVGPKVASEGTSSAILLTDAESIDDYEGGDLFLAPNVWVQERSLDGMPARRLSTIGQLPLKKDGLSEITLLGNGLSSDDWARLPVGLQVNWRPPNIEGFADARWNKELLLGETLSISTRFFSPKVDEEIFTITLSDLADEIVDETTAISQQVITLNARPKASGQLTYNLRAYAADDTLIAEELIRVSVSPAAPVKILVLQSAPSFETRHMMDWATRFNASLLIKTQISRDRYLTQSVNADSIPENEIMLSERLSGFDLLLMDGRMYLSLTDEENAVLSSAVEGGLGVMIAIDSDLAAAWPTTGFLANFSLNVLDGDETSSTPILPAIANAQALPTLPIDLENDAAITLIVGEDGRRLEMAQAVGLGNVAVSVLRQKYTWATGGRLDLYSAYWAQLMRNVARQNQEILFLPTQNRVVPRAHNKRKICVLSWATDLSISVNQMPDGVSMSFPLQRDALNSPRQCGAFWPKEIGWHDLVVSGGQDNVSLNASLYIYGEEDWQSQDAFKRQQETMNYIERQDGSALSPVRAIQYHAIDRFWVWLILVMGATALWIENKLRRR